MTSEISLRTKKVLLVDNHPDAREARSERLRDHGVTVEAVSTIREARFFLRAERYDLVLLATREDPEAAIVFREEILENPKQQVAFLVGHPPYISFTYGEDGSSTDPSGNWAEREATARL